ncbi:hypothetical protein [Paraburkholderia youngii]|uniref:hypothetical protein n=1 Tax=Paraburkholderia youngii TaxID=2782701 RepID=UPI001591688F|nr:hypothetical protein [Paraburkholderia youngii]NUX57686.1 hypothetical protein [Paraburkholderia youngii]
MNDRTGGEQEPQKLLTREKILAALDTKPVFEIASRGVGTITVTSMLANTLERISDEFGREDSDDDTKLRCLLCEIGQTNGDDGQSTPISASLADHVTSDELADFARKVLVSEEWAREEEAADETDPKRRVVKAIRGDIAAAEASYRKILDALGPSISAATRASISNATLVADKLRRDIAAASSPSLRAIEALQMGGSIAKLGTPIAEMQKSIAIGGALREQVQRLKDSVPSFDSSSASSRIQSIPPLINPTATAAKATAESAAKMEEVLGRLEQRANDSALVIAGIQSMIRDTTLDMAKNALESSAAAKQSLDQAAESLAIGAQSLKWAKYALMTSVGIGFISLVFAAISAWYAVYPATTARSPNSTTEASHAPLSAQPKPTDQIEEARAASVTHTN